MDEHDETAGELVRAARKKRGLSQTELAGLVDTDQQTIGKIEKGIIRHSRLFPKLALELSLPLDRLMPGAAPIDLTAPESTLSIPHNAEIGGGVVLSHKIPVYGHAEGGADGSFPLNGNRMGDILAPPALVGIADAYAVYVVGDSMEPRYYAGEVVFVNPRMPVRQGDYVVAQIVSEVEGEPPRAFIKQYLGKGSRTVKFEQHNPKKTLVFAAKSVETVHRIVMGGTSI